MVQLLSVWSELLFNRAVLVSLYFPCEQLPQGRWSNNDLRHGGSVDIAVVGDSKECPAVAPSGQPRLYAIAEPDEFDLVKRVYKSTADNEAALTTTQFFVHCSTEGNNGRSRQNACKYASVEGRDHGTGHGERICCRILKPVGSGSVGGCHSCSQRRTRRSA